MAFILLLSLLHLTLALSPQRTLSIEADASSDINEGSARTNANLIFNAIHSAMRQWGSSLQHNGMSFFPACIPKGTLLYHGTGTRHRVTGMEWLAFELEHAGMFAFGKPHQSNLLPDNEIRDDPLLRPPPEPGYLHVYRTNRPLGKLLYLDGMAAGKSSLGTLDTQDLVLLGLGLSPHADYQRAHLLCELGKTWDIEGFVRMEAGFELILCNFSDGLDFVSHNKQPPVGDPEGYGDRFFLEYIRAISSRYDEIGASRVMLDYSSMISAFFFPVNLSNPESSSSLPRLAFSSPEQLAPIKTQLEDVLQRPRTYSCTNWKGVVDLIVTRYSVRLQYLATSPSQDSFLATINNLLNPFIDYGADLVDKLAIEKCALHYIESLPISTGQDELIFAAISTLNRRICKTLFEVRRLLLMYGKESQNGVDMSIKLIRELMEWLDWSTWKACPSCQYDEVCFVAVWPFGNVEDHNSPRCLNNTELKKRRGFGKYWHNTPSVSNITTNDALRIK
ncbi:MAG: hypothetical protein M1818_001754 [Claussenomyces sp. TS43310]|nr:MAG: hypothetical protein M1818_001754 [Claussenomyces sp. TS43310]